MKRLYLAYGSNLNLEQMEYRCPTAKVYGKGMIENYRLIFKGVPGNAYLTIEPEEGSKVPVLVWDIKEGDERSLDRYEGYPNFYYKEDVIIKLENGEKVEAMVYIMTDKQKDRINPNLPSETYLLTVAQGYKEAGFDLDIIKEALKVSGS